MCLSIEYILIQADQLRLSEDQVEILESLGHPKRLHSISFGWIFRHRAIVESSMRDIGDCVLDDTVEHRPSSFTQTSITRNTIKYKYRLYCLGSSES